MSKKVYRLGPVIASAFHRDALPALAAEYFAAGAFYCVGSLELVFEWANMNPHFNTRSVYEIELRDDAQVVLYKGWTGEAIVADDLSYIAKEDFGDGEYVIDPEECQLIVKLDDVVSQHIIM